MLKFNLYNRRNILEHTELKKINQLIVRVSKLDKSAIGEIFNLIGGRMNSIAFGVLKNRSLSEEAVSEALVKIVNNADKFTYFSNGYAWICKIVKNTALNILERENYFTKTDIEEIYDLPDSDNNNDKMEDFMLIEQSLKRLSKRELHIIRLRFWEELKIRDIAKEMDLPTTTAQELLAHSIEKMKKYIDKK